MLQAHYNLYALLSEVAKTRPEYEQEAIEHLHKAAEAEILLAIYALATRYSEVSVVVTASWLGSALTDSITGPWCAAGWRARIWTVQTSSRQRQVEHSRDCFIDLHN